MLRPEVPAAFALNRLLEAEPRARERLAVHAEATIVVEAAPMPALRFVVRADGLIDPARTGEPASLRVRVSPSTIRALLQSGGSVTDEVVATIDVDGSAGLANELLVLARHLRWDVEGELSRLVGDIAAQRISGVVRGLLSGSQDAARRLAATGARWAVDEGRHLVGRGELEELRSRVAELQRALDRFEGSLSRRPRA